MSGTGDDVRDDGAGDGGRCLLVDLGGAMFGVPFSAVGRIVKGCWGAMPVVGSGPDGVVLSGAVLGLGAVQGVAYAVVDLAALVGRVRGRGAGVMLCLSEARVALRVDMVSDVLPDGAGVDMLDLAGLLEGLL